MWAENEIEITPLARTALTFTLQEVLRVQPYFPVKQPHLRVLPCQQLQRL
jgi:hypothetical protein